MKNKIKIGIISCEDAPGWGGEEGLCNYIIKRFQNINSDVEYVQFHAITGNLPMKSDLHQFIGFVISGSHYSVNDGHDWISNLIEFVQNIRDDIEGPSLFGICFGQQLIAKAFGGEVGKNESGKFVWGTEEVEGCASQESEEFYRESFGEKRLLKVMQSHGEWVSVLPEGAVCLGKSRTCKYEILSYGNRIMSTQGHPELLKEAMIGNILPRLKKSGAISDNEEEVAKKTLTDEDHTMLMKFVYKFLTFST